MVLYHAISTLQIIQCIIHHKVYTNNEYGVLVLPDFITAKFSNPTIFTKYGLMDEVKILRYMSIQHNEKTLHKMIKRRYYVDIGIKIKKFSSIYVAGAHFYFSIYLIDKKIPFYCFEDAAGMLSRSEEMYNTLRCKFPVHAEVAKKNGLFALDNPFIKGVFCHKASQTIDCSDKRYIDFDTLKLLENMNKKDRENIRARRHNI